MVFRIINRSRQFPIQSNRRKYLASSKCPYLSVTRSNESHDTCPLSRVQCLESGVSRTACTEGTQLTTIFQSKHQLNNRMDLFPTILLQPSSLLRRTTCNAKVQKWVNSATSLKSRYSEPCWVACTGREGGWEVVYQDPSVTIKLTHITAPHCRQGYRT